MDLLTTYTHDPETQAITALSLIYTTAHSKPQSFIVFPSRCLVTALNNSSASVLTSLPLANPTHN
jgi:hypothetical protein